MDTLMAKSARYCRARLPFTFRSRRKAMAKQAAGKINSIPNSCGSDA